MTNDEMMPKLSNLLVRAQQFGQFVALYTKDRSRLPSKIGDDFDDLPPAAQEATELPLVDLLRQDRLRVPPEKLAFLDPMRLFMLALHPGETRRGWVLRLARHTHSIPHSTKAVYGA